MANYLPYAGRNAIAEITAGINYAHAVTDIAAANSDAIKAAFSADLPRYEAMNMVSLNITPPGVATGANVTPGIGGFTLSKVKNDGTPSRLLRMMANVISIHLLEYDDWTSVKNRVVEYFNRLLLITERSAPHLVNGFFMRILDRFTFDGSLEQADASLLFKKNTKYLPDISFSCGAAWHVNSGWFDEKEGGNRILYQLNTSSNLVGNVLTISIDHNGSLMLPAMRQKAKDVLSDTMGLSLPGFLDLVHQSNRDIIVDLLVADMSSAIGLTQEPSGRK
jgi:uncharacterized protein (TIGR04255 family)